MSFGTPSTPIDPKYDAAIANAAAASVPLLAEWPHMTQRYLAFMRREMGLKIDIHHDVGWTDAENL